MNATERLLAGEATDFERELLGSWQTRQPSPEARTKALARVGMGVGAAALTAATAKTAGSSVAPKAIAATSVLLKWLAVGAVGATLTAGSIGYVHREHALEASRSTEVGEAPPMPAAPAVPASPTTNEAAPPIELGPDTAPLPHAAASRSDRPQTPRATATTPSKAASASKSTLDDEVATIDEARRAEGAGDFASALRLLDAYDVKYRGGSLARESTEIRIQALVQQGNRPAAERLAARFIASHPSSLDVRNIRRALDPGRP